jgi:anti-sigma-K factor RskA
VTTDTDHAEVGELLGAFVLDAVSGAEASLVRSHLAHCPRCRAETDALLEVAGALGSTVENLPPHLWDLIAEGLGDPLSGLMSAPVIGIGVVSTPPSFTTPASTDRLVRGRWTQRGRWRRGAVSLLAVAAMVVVAVLAVDLSMAKGTVSRLNAAIASRGERAAVAAALVTPGHRLVDLRTGEDTPGVELVLLPNGTGYLVSTSLPALTDDETYQLWGVIDDQPVSLGLLGSRPLQAGFTVASATPTLLMVTVEPAGGVPTPDRSPVASGVVTPA